MYNICIFGGTTEGRRLIEFLSAHPIRLTVCVATEYGEDLLDASEHMTVLPGRMDEDEMEAFFGRSAFDLVIDATHPYAENVTKNLCVAALKTHTEYMRLQREDSVLPKSAIFVKNVSEAVQFLNTVSGNILLTTGSKDIEKFMDVDGFNERVYARILPMGQSLDACHRAGLKAAHIIAMQGPFSADLNCEMIKYANASYVVTKEGGNAGGFNEKSEAAQKAGVKLVVIGRPKDAPGLPFNEMLDALCQRFHLRSHPEIAIIGIGPGDTGCLTQKAAEFIRNADCIIGAKRMVDAVTGNNTSGLPGQEVITVNRSAALSGHAVVFHEISGKKIASIIYGHPQFRQIAVVMSGDTGYFSGAKKLLELLPDENVHVFPGLSSLTYLCSRLKTSYEDVVSVSLHGRNYNIINDVSTNKRTFALVGGDDGMVKLLKELCQSGFGNVRVSIGERLSYPDERIVTGTASELVGIAFDSLSAALIENENASVSMTVGLPDSCFVRNKENIPVVPMTKSEVRAVILSKLALNDHSICWDIGAGTGSVSVEMALNVSNGEVYAVEMKSEAIELINENRQKFGLENNLFVIHGNAPQACETLPAPTHVFIGGSSGGMRDIIRLAIEKNRNVRIVATAITLESVSTLLDCIKEHAFEYQETVLVNISKARCAGKYHLMMSENPVYIITMQHKGDEMPCCL